MGQGRAGVAPAGRRRCGAGKGAGCTAGLKARAAHGACATVISSSGSGPARLWKYGEVCAEGFARLEHIFKRPAGVVDRLWRPDGIPATSVRAPPRRFLHRPRQEHVWPHPGRAAVLAAHGFGLERPVRRGRPLVAAQGYLPQIVLVQINLQRIRTAEVVRMCSSVH